MEDDDDDDRCGSAGVSLSKISILLRKARHGTRAQCRTTILPSHPSLESNEYEEDEKETIEGMKMRGRRSMIFRNCLPRRRMLEWRFGQDYESKGIDSFYFLDSSSSRSGFKMKVSSSIFVVVVIQWQGSWAGVLVDHTLKLLYLNLIGSARDRKPKLRHRIDRGLSPQVVVVG